MQSLCLNVEVLSADGVSIDMKENDDEVFRAAEELGIDLSRRSEAAASTRSDVEPCRPSVKGGRRARTFSNISVQPGHDTGKRRK